MEKIQEIINKGIEEYEKNNKIIGYKKKTIKAIKDCKTGELGAHKYVCDECGYEEIAYNSCRNRHCPNCQIMKKLNDKEKMIITKRFFDGRTQMEVAEEIGISQAQVSRLEKNAIEHIKRLYK